MWSIFSSLGLNEKEKASYAPFSDLWQWLWSDQQAFPARMDCTLKIRVKVNPSSVRLLLRGYFFLITETGLMFKLRGGGHNYPWGKHAVQVAGTPCSAWGAQLVAREESSTAFSVSHGDIIQHPALLWLGEGNLTVTARVTWGPLSPG